MYSFVTCDSCHSLWLMSSYWRRSINLAVLSLTLNLNWFSLLIWTIYCWPVPGADTWFSWVEACFLLVDVLVQCCIVTAACPQGLAALLAVASEASSPHPQIASPAPLSLFVIFHTVLCWGLLRQNRTINHTLPCKLWEAGLVSFLTVPSTVGSWFMPGFPRHYCNIE